MLADPTLTNQPGVSAFGASMCTLLGLHLAHTRKLKDLFHKGHTGTMACHVCKGSRFWTPENLKDCAKTPPSGVQVDKAQDTLVHVAVRQASVESSVFLWRLLCRTQTGQAQAFLASFHPEHLALLSFADVPNLSNALHTACMPASKGVC